MEPSPLHKRAVILMFFLFLWAALVAARLFYFTVVARGEYLAAVERLSMRDGRIPVIRGRILDDKGNMLAWSERHLDVILTEIPDFTPRRERLECGISKMIPDFSLSTAHKGMILKRDISPEDELSFSRLVAKFREIAFYSRVEREKVRGPVSKLIGSLTTVEGCVRGVSGYEKLYDDELRGREGVYQVMVDRSGRWIPGTWRELIKPLNGKDVVVAVP